MPFFGSGIGNLYTATTSDPGWYTTSTSTGTGSAHTHPWYLSSMGGTSTTACTTSSSTIYLDAQQYQAARYQALLGLRQQEAMALQQVAAIERATELLLENLTPLQRETYRRKGWFVVEGGHSKRQYRIRSGSVIANIDDIKGNRRLCAHVNPLAVPMPDQYLAQKLWLECDENGFLRVARTHAGADFREEVRRGLAEAAAAIANEAAA